MEQNYFIYNGRRYGAGTTIKVKNYNYTGNKDCEQEAIFDRVVNNKFVIRIGDKRYVYPKDMFYKILLEVDENIDSQYSNKMETYQSSQNVNKKIKLTDEFKIDGLFIAWVWYIFIMAVATIFYSRIGIWILASIVFFSYRNKKLREAGYKS